MACLVGRLFIAALLLPAGLQKLMVAWPRWTALVLVALTVVTTWATYRFGVFTAIFRQPQPVQLMKSLAVIAGLLFYFASGPGGGA